MKFCPECGAKLEGSPKFCPECGTKFGETKKGGTPPAATPEAASAAPVPPPQPADTSEPLPQPKPAASAYELGIRLEDVVEQIFKADGYETQRRQRLPGVKGYHNEIDIVAIRGKDRVAVECKNFSQPVGISQVRDFAEKILDLGPGWRGIFIGYNDFTEDANQFAESRNIEQIGRDEVMEKWFALSVGRSGKQGEKITIEQALPVNVDFLAATSLDLANKEKVAINEVRLVYHPYIRYTYHFKRIFTDPAKEKHTFDERGTVVIDLLDNSILNKPKVKNVEGFAQKLTDTFSSKGRQENSRRVALLDEVIDNIPKKEVALTIGEDYRVSKLAIDYSKRDVNRVALEYIIDKNSERISYSVESRSGFPESRSIEFVPDRKDIAIDNGEVVCVPKWEIHFNAQGTIYSREVLACSGKKLEDTIAYCPHHFKLGFLEVRQKNYAVCEKCGTAFCKVHGRICEVCKIHLCENHAIICTSCKRSFCEDHISKKCEICGGFVCDDCIRTCPVCGKKVGLDHLVKCDVCGKEVCSSCVSVTGLIKKKRTCKKCQ
jgi:predicted RecB family endonuclease